MGRLRAHEHHIPLTYCSDLTGPTPEGWKPTMKQPVAINLKVFPMDRESSERLDQYKSQSDVLSEEEPEGDQWRQSPRSLSPKRETEEQKWVNHYANEGLPVGWAEQGSKCDRCQQVIADRVWRLYPTNCSRCWKGSVCWGLMGSVWKISS